MADVPGEFDVGFDEEPPDSEELPPVLLVEAAETEESFALEPAAAPVTPLHPQPQRARVISTKKSRKNGESCGRK
jgi:hypothetical protein